MWVIGVAETQGHTLLTEGANKVRDYIGWELRNTEGRKFFFWRQKSSLFPVLSSYYSYSNLSSGIVDLKYSALFDIPLFSRFSLFVHP